MARNIGGIAGYQKAHRMKERRIIDPSSLNMPSTKFPITKACVVTFEGPLVKERTFLDEFARKQFGLLPVRGNIGQVSYGIARIGVTESPAASTAWRGIAGFQAGRTLAKTC